MNPKSPKTEEESTESMAVSCSPNPLSMEQIPSLPPIRELLPDHIHRHADSGLYVPHSHAASFASTPYNEWTAKRKLSSPPPPSPRGLGSRESAPRSLLSDSGSPHLPPPRSSPTNRPRSSFGSFGSRRTLPPIRDLRDRREGLGGYPLNYDQSPRSGHHPLQTIHKQNSSLPPPLDQASLYASPSSSPRYGSFHPPYSAEPDYLAPRVVSPQSPPNPAALMGDIGESRHKKRRGNLPKPVTDILRAWFLEHLDHPYPSEEDKQMFITRTGLTISQISNWFINARRRLLPALRNQTRAAEGGSESRPDSPMSDAPSLSSASSQSQT